MAIYEIGQFDGIALSPSVYEELGCVAAAGLTAATLNPGGSSPIKAKGAVIVVVGAPIHYRVDGGAPTTTVGIPAAVGDEIKLFGFQVLSQFKAIQDSATASLHVTYFF